MSAQASVTILSPKERRYVDFPPTVWGNHFALFDFENLKLERTLDEEVEKLKEEVKNMLIAPVESPMQKLDLIDSIQRLGVSYHFESEIGTLLEEIFKNYVGSKSKDNGLNLYYDSLMFRLLRQEGFHISCDIFKKFKDADGNFKAETVEEPRALLSLYEAANYSLHGEYILDEALVFARERLEALAGLLSPQATEEITYVLKFPLRRNISRIDARHFMSAYKGNSCHNKHLLTLANWDFNILQKFRQQEIREISRWWKDVDLSSKLPFARDRIVECYFWSLIAIPEPQFSSSRKFVTKVAQMASITDDIYDLHGTYEEIQLLTYAIERWDINMKNNLPNYLQVYYEALLNLYVDIERELGINGESFRMKCAKEAMKRLAKAYMGEAQWFHKRVTPTIDEYYEFGLTTSCFPLFMASTYLCMGDVIPNEAFEWIMENPKILEASNVIGRLMNDLVSNEFEQGRGHSASSIESYIKQFHVSREAACDVLRKRIEDAWKDINQCSMRPLAFPMAMLSPIINYARASHVSYIDNDGYTIVSGATKHYITSLLVDQISL